MGVKSRDMIPIIHVNFNVCVNKTGHVSGAADIQTGGPYIPPPASKNDVTKCHTQLMIIPKQHTRMTFNYKILKILINQNKILKFYNI